MAAKILTSVRRPKLGLSQQRLMLVKSPTATRPRPVHLPPLKQSAQNDASSIIWHITVRITGVHKVGAHTTRISCSIPMRRLAVGNGAAFLSDTLLIKTSYVPKVTASLTRASCIIRTSGRAVRLGNALPPASSSILLSITARKVAKKSQIRPQGNL